MAQSDFQYTKKAVPVELAATTLDCGLEAKEAGKAPEGFTPALVFRL